MLFGIVINESLLGYSVETNDPMVNITERYKTHPSIRLIKRYSNQLGNIFSFEQITYEDIHRDKKTRLHKSFSGY